jgi:hypothetical protein
VEISAVKGILYIRHQFLSFCTFFLTLWVQLSADDMHSGSFNDDGVHENWRSENHTSLRDINEFMSAHSTRAVQFG